MSKTCLIVQARLNSTRIKNKMLKSFGNSTLLDILLKKLKQSNIINNNDVYLSLYEEELKNIVKKYDFNIYQRSKESAYTENDMKLMFEWWNKLPYDNYIIISACHPFLSIKTIEEFYKKSLTNDKKGLFGVVRRKNYYWNSEKKMITKWPFGQTTFNTKAVEYTYEAAHCLYAGKMVDIGNYIYMGDFSNDEIELFVIDNEFECLDIDEPWQFNLYESYYKDISKINK